MVKKVKITYEQDPAYRLLPVQGAHIGISPTGDLVVDVYVERSTSPTELTLELEAPSTLREVDKKGERHVRQILTGLVMRPDVAYSLGEWLIQKAKLTGIKPDQEQ